MTSNIKKELTKRKEESSPLIEPTAALRWGIELLDMDWNHDGSVFESAIIDPNSSPN